MKKSALFMVPLLLVFLFGGLISNYGEVGQMLYDHSMKLESNLSGLEAKKADIGEMEMSYYIHANANKPTLIMLHGYSSDKNVWIRFAKHFTDDYQVVIPDLAGHGDTPYDESWSYSMPAQAQRVVALMNVLGIEQAHIIGNSMGGFLTATLAIHYPQHTLSAVMIDAAGVMSPEPSDLYKMLEQGHNPFLVQNRKEFDQFFDMTMHQRPFMPDIVIEAVSNKYISRRHQLEKIFNDFSQSDTVENDLDKIIAPAMVWWGDKDRLLDVSAVPVWEAGIPNVQTHIFKDVGHMPMMEVPKDSAQVYHDFLLQL